MFTWGVIGLLVGSVMGLAGAGGALIAVPFLVHLAEKTIFEATLISLIPVFFASSLNWFFQKNLTHYLTAIMIACFSFFGSYLFSDIKLISSPLLVKSTYLSLAVIGAILIWRKKKSTAHSKPNKQSLLFLVKTVLSGFILGVIITMTGLGGGVLLTPWLHYAFKYPLKNAVATSLFTTTIATAISFFNQKTLLSKTEILPQQILLLIIGILIAAIAIKLTTKQYENLPMDQIRKWVYTTVVLFSVIAMLL